MGLLHRCMVEGCLLHMQVVEDGSVAQVGEGRSVAHVVEGGSVAKVVEGGSVEQVVEGEFFCRCGS